MREKKLPTSRPSIPIKVGSDTTTDVCAMYLM